MAKYAEKSKSLNGGMAPECERFHKHIAQKITEKTSKQYSHVISMIRCKLSFMILRSCLMCVRGSRPHSVRNESNVPCEYGQAVTDARISAWIHKKYLDENAIFEELNTSTPYNDHVTFYLS